MADRFTGVPRGLANRLARHPMQVVQGLHLVTIVGFLMTIPTDRPFPGFTNVGANALSTVAEVVIDDTLQRCNTSNGNSIWLNHDTPDIVAELIMHLLDASSQCGNLFQHVVMHTCLCRQQSAFLCGQNNVLMGRELCIFVHNFLMGFATHAPTIPDEIVLCWSRHCCGVLSGGLALGAKLQLAVTETILAHCPNLCAGHNNHTIENVFPKSLPIKICWAVDRHIKLKHPTLITWWDPDLEDAEQALNHCELIQDRKLLHVSDVLACPGTHRMEKATWVNDTRGCPLAEGDVNDNLAQDGNLPDNGECHLRQHDVNGEVVRDAQDQCNDCMLDHRLPAQTGTVGQGPAAGHGVLAPNQGAPNGAAQAQSCLATLANLVERESGKRNVTPFIHGWLCDVPNPSW